MTTDELYRKILEILPNATIDEDLDGQLVIYTDKRETTGGEIIDYEVTD
jgi:hypothetical protein